MAPVSARTPAGGMARDRRSAGQFSRWGPSDRHRPRSGRNSLRHSPARHTRQERRLPAGTAARRAGNAGLQTGIARTAGETPSATHPHGTHVRNAGFRPAPRPARAAKPRTALHPHGADPREGRLRSLLTPRQTPDARVAAGFHAREEPRSGNRGDSPHPPDRPRKGVRDRGRRARPASSGWCGAPR